jgi:hypothetical protein
MPFDEISVLLGKDREGEVLDPREALIYVNGELLADRFPYGLRGLTTSELPPARHFFGDADEHMKVGDRVALLVCPLCGDLGCGAVLCRITVTDAVVTWSGFVYGTNYEPSEDRTFDLILRFDRPAYEEAFARAARAAS